MIDASLSELRARLDAREVSSRELAEACLARIAEQNPNLNAFVAVNPERSLAQADAADRRLAAGDGGPLTGIPLAHKDIFCANGWRTTCGSRMLADFVSPYDATVVARCDAAGAVNLGKLNMDEFAMGSSNESSHFGPVRNPWDRQRVPGGSSGGSAAAVAAGLVPVATGTDTGGSIRQPAAWCGLTGLKPTYGAVSRWGMVAYASSLDQGGPIARSAADCALLLNAIAGFDDKDSTSVERPVEDYTRGLANGGERRLDGLRIGLPKEFFGPGIAPGVRAAVDAAVGRLKDLGADLREVSLPNAGLSLPAYYVIALAEASSNLSRFDGVRYGYRAPEYGDLADMYAKTRAQGFGAEVKRRILVGTYVLSHGYYDAYYLQAQKIRRLIADDFRRAFAECDVIAGPTTPTTAFRLGEKADDPVQMYLDDIFTVPVNLAGLPAMSIPCGFVDGLPVGLQLIGNYFAEARLIGTADAYQQLTDWHVRRPAPGAAA
jgi:aspartyl-tRNA(Asn)/glutamyl-tRNA(Gln) amidotransferase subunit A